MKIKGTYILREVTGMKIVVPVGKTTADFSGMITLNDTGAFLWQQLEQEISREELIARLLDEYEVSAEKAAVDVDAFLNKMKENGLVE